MTISSQAKAIVAGVGAGAASLATALTDNHLTAGEAALAVAAAAAAYGATWAVPNRDAE